MESVFNRFSSKAITHVLILLIIYCLWIWLFVGFRNDHLFLIFFCLSCYFFHHLTRKFITAFFIFIVYWIVYDAMRVIPNYTVNAVHIREPYDFEKAIFGININHVLLTPNEYFNLHTSTLADLIAGLFYINWVPVPLAFAFFLMVKDKIFFLRFSYAFVLTNFIGFIIYYLYPAAPPWYVSQYGFEFNQHVPASTAGLARFDDYFGISLFHSLYSKNANIFAAIPSLHAAYPFVVLYYGLKRKMGWINILFVIFLLGIWFAAVYSFHHYIIDLLLGALCAFIGIYLLEHVLLKFPKIKNWFNNLVGMI